MQDFLELGKRIGVRERLLKPIEKEFSAAKSDMLLLADKSFLFEKGKQKYKEVLVLHHHQLFNTR